MGSADYVSLIILCCFGIVLVKGRRLVCILWRSLGRGRGLTDLCRALYIRGDPYETSDAVFGVKNSLIVDFEKADGETAKKYDVKVGSLVLRHDFVLVSENETSSLRDQRSTEALEALGKKVKIVYGLPIPDVD